MTLAEELANKMFGDPHGQRCDWDSVTANSNCRYAVNAALERAAQVSEKWRDEHKGFSGFDGNRQWDCRTEIAAEIRALINAQRSEGKK